MSRDSDPPPCPRLVLWILALCSLASWVLGRNPPCTRLYRCCWGRRTSHIPLSPDTRRRSWDRNSSGLEGVDVQRKEMENGYKKKIVHVLLQLFLCQNCQIKFNSILLLINIPTNKADLDLRSVVKYKHLMALSFCYAIVFLMHDQTRNKTTLVLKCQPKN